jgi:RecA-family ATPase
VWRSLESTGTRFLRGQLVLIAAGPGTGKSMVALCLALAARLPTLYFSADSDAFTQLQRSLSRLAGISLSTAATAILNDGVGAFDDVLNGVPIRFNYDASPSLDLIERLMEGYEEVHGEYPSLVVVDNLMNVQRDDEEDRDGVLTYLHAMARETGACVIVLHHVTGPHNDGDRPIPLSGVKDQVTAVPEMVLTLHKRHDEGQPDLLCVSTVKNRGGSADPSGRRFVELVFEGDRMVIEDQPNPVAG